MMIDFGKSQIFVREMAQAFESGVDVHSARAHLFKQCAQMILIHKLLV